MIAKILAFVLLSLGALAAVGVLSATFPGVSHTAMHLGERAVTYGNLLFATAVGVVLWITSKV